MSKKTLDLLSLLYTHTNTHAHTQREREREIDRQTDRQTHRHTEKTVDGGQGGIGDREKVERVGSGKG